MNKLIEIDELKLELKKTQKLYLESLNRIDNAIECIKNRNTTKSKKERFMSGETTLEKLLEILGGINEHRK